MILLLGRPKRSGQCSRFEIASSVSGIGALRRTLAVTLPHAVNIVRAVQRFVRQHL